jgi:hypothetical protein
MATVNKANATGTADGVPYVGFGVSQDPGGVTGFGSAYDFPQDTQQHFEGYGKALAGDDALGSDMDGDSPGDTMGTSGRTP